MDTIQILNIPNFYCSYYLLGLRQAYKIEFKMNPAFEKFNNKPLLIFQINNKIGVIDNDDPTGVNEELYELATIYFVTNKLSSDATYSKPKVKPLYPHYPINIVLLYITTFQLGLFRYLRIKDLAKQVYTLLRRPVYKRFSNSTEKEKFVFFTSNIWKKEAEANQLRAEFIRFCKAEERIKFEGGFVPRSDHNNFDFGDILNQVTYSPKTFSKLSSKSLIALNNPAVCGAVSWRLAEYLNQGLFVMTFPFKIELPRDLVNGSEAYFIKESSEYKHVLDMILEQPKFHDAIATNGKVYFDTYCTPTAQAKYIIALLK